ALRALGGDPDTPAHHRARRRAPGSRPHSGHRPHAGLDRALHRRVEILDEPSPLGGRLVPWHERPGFARSRSEARAHSLEPIALQLTFSTLVRPHAVTARATPITTPPRRVMKAIGARNPFWTRARTRRMVRGNGQGGAASLARRTARGACGATRRRRPDRCRRRWTSRPRTPASGGARCRPRRSPPGTLT